MNKYKEILNYKRLYSVDSLYSMDSFLLNSKYLEFENCNSFFNFLKLFPDFNKKHQVVISVYNEKDLKHIFQINQKVFKSIYIYLKNITKNILNTIIAQGNKNGYYRLIIDSSNIDSLKEQSTDELEKVLKRTTCIYRDIINIDNYKNLVYVYQDPFFKFPYFNNSEISYDWESLSYMNFFDLRSLIQQYRYYLNNLYKLGSTCIEGNIIKYNEYYNSTNFKVVYINDEGISIKNDKDSFISFDDILNRNIDLNMQRTPYDINYSYSMDIDTSLIDIAQNKKCSGSYLIPPEIYKIIFDLRKSVGVYNA